MMSTKGWRNCVRTYIAWFSVDSNDDHEHGLQEMVFYFNEKREVEKGIQKHVIEFFFNSSNKKMKLTLRINIRKNVHLWFLILSKLFLVLLDSSVFFHSNMRVSKKKLDCSRLGLRFMKMSYKRMKKTIGNKNFELIFFLFFRKSSKKMCAELSTDSCFIYKMRRQNELYTKDYTSAYAQVNSLSNSSL